MVRPPFAVIRRGRRARPRSFATSSRASPSAPGGEAGAIVGFGLKAVEKEEARI